MGGLAILLIILAYLAAVLWLAVKVRGRWRKALVLLVAFLLPTTDGYLGRKYVEHLCAEDGGLKVFRVVENVDGVSGLMPDRGTLERTKFEFIEIDRAAGDPSRAYQRVERLPDGEIIERFDSESRAKYGYRLNSVRSQFLGVVFGYQDSEVIDLASSTPLARYRQFNGAAGWAERFLASFTDAGGVGAQYCPDFEKRPGPEQLVLSVLKPSKR